MMETPPPPPASRLIEDASEDRAHEFLAGRFAMKEAVYKALAPVRTAVWTDIETVLPRVDGHPPVLASTPGLERALAALVDARGVTGGACAHVSLSHDAGIATAFAVIESAAKEGG